jgi:hypothetical protein
MILSDPKRSPGGCRGSFSPSAPGRERRNRQSHLQRSACHRAETLPSPRGDRRQVDRAVLFFRSEFDRESVLRFVQVKIHIPDIQRVVIRMDVDRHPDAAHAELRG